MITGWQQEFKAGWKCGGEEGTSVFRVLVELDGPARDFMTDVDPTYDEIQALADGKLHEHGMRSTAEGLALHVKGIVERHLEGTPDTLRRVRVFQDEDWWTEL